jgi:membrane associated rhomboid family serine protease
VEQPWRPQGTYALLALCAGVYVLQLIAYGVQQAALLALTPETTVATLPMGLLYTRGQLFGLHDWTFVIGTDFLWRPWTLLTSTVAHSPTSIMHLLFNGLFLFFFGPTVERLVGTKRLLLLFFVGGAVSGVLQVELAHLADPTSPAGALGASGALMLLFGILIAVLPNEKLLVYGLIPVPFWIAGIGYAALDVLGALNPASTVGNFAHLSGLALGLGYGVWQKREWRKRGVTLVRGTR